MLDELDTMTQQYVQTEQPATEAKSVESPKENNLRIMRERAEAAERRTQELERMIQMNMNQQQPQKIQIAEDEDEFDVSDDTYIEGKQFKKYVKNLKQEIKNTKKQFEEYSQRASSEQAESRLKSQFNDFDSVVTVDNIKKLESQKPSLFRSIMATQDIYDRGYTAYELIKSSGLAEDSYAKENQRLEENRTKPRSAASVAPQAGENPLARVGDYDRRVLTNERKEQLLRQVAEAKMYKQ